MTQQPWDPSQYPQQPPTPPAGYGPGYNAGYGPPTGPPAPPAKKGRKWLWWVGGIVGVFLLIGIIGAATGAGDEDDDGDEVSAADTTEVAEDTEPDDESEATEPAPTTEPEPETTTTEEPTTTTEPEPTTTTAPPVGTHDNPVPVGVPVPMGDYTLTILGTERDVTQLVRSFNQFNDPPPDGGVYIRLHVTYTYNGDGTSNSFLIPRLNLTDPGNATYEDDLVSGGSGGEPETIFDQPDTFNGGSITGYLYYVMPVDSAAGPLLAFTPDVNFTDVPGGVAFLQVP